MMTDILNNPVFFLVWLGSLIVGITVHEFAHAYAADRLGDPTPSLQGRLTLNPLAHLDPIGTLMILFVRFGWGKPVQFDPFNLRHPVRDAAIISLAGPVSNLIFATIVSILYHVLSPLTLNPMFGIIAGVLKPLIIMNVSLAVFNLIPIHPLDGFAVVRGILPDKYARQWQELQPYGPIFLLGMVFLGFGPVTTVISGVTDFILSILLPTGGII